MIKKLFTVVSILLLAITFWPAVIVLIVARIMNNKKWGDIAECILWWNLIPFVLPFRAKKLGVISKRIYAWLLVMVSPIFIHLRSHYRLYGLLYIHHAKNHTLQDQE